MENLYRAFFNSQRGHVVLGRRLRPFSNWHVLQLQCAESPLIGFPGEIMLASLILALSVCATSFPHRFAAVRGRELIGHALALRVARRAPDREFLRWTTYLRDYSAQPEMLEQEKGGKYCECPGPLAVVAVLMKYGFGEAEAWDMPVGRASWYKIALAEAEGAEIKLLTDPRRKAMVQAGWGELVGEGPKP